MKKIMTLALLFSLNAQAESQQLTVGTGSAKFNGLVQVWENNDSTNPTTGNSFRLRRSELKFGGNIIPEVRWYLMIDPTKSLKTGPISASNDNKILQDILVGFTVAPGLEFTMGQFKLQTTAEGLDSAGELLFPERSFMARTYGERRDPGFMVTYTRSIVKLTGTITNGQGPNVDDTNNKKDLVFRVDVAPTDQVKVGAFTQAGDFSYANRARFGINGRYTLNEWIVRTEIAHGYELGVNTNGWVVDAAYSINEHWQPVIRYDGFSTGTFIASTYTLGANYYLDHQHAKIQLAYEALQNMIGNFGSYIPSSAGNGSQVTLVFAVSI